MVFSSLSFLFFFLPLVLLSYFLLRSRVYRNAVLLLFSLLFYSWGEPKYIFLMLAVCMAAYAGGLLIEKYRGRPALEKPVFIAVVVLLLSGLFIFKYLNFAADNLAALLGRESSLAPIALPIGISFYTFQTLSYVIDLHRGKISVQRNPLSLLLYVSFFPQLIAGPIVRYSTIEGELTGRCESTEDVVYGFKRFILGLAKKMIIANNVATVASSVYTLNAGSFGTAMYWLAALSFTLQIYFDFSGYSDMAIGLGRIFGFHFLENFEHPYIADSMTDFWRRWHISLSSWFRDYVYIPLGGNRVSRPRWLLNLLLVWACTGLWHGAEWNFLFWGLYNGLILVVEKLWLMKYLERLPQLARRLLTFAAVNVGFVFFNLSDLGELGSALRMMFVPRATDWLGAVAADGTLTRAMLYIPLGLVCMLPLGKHIQPPRSRLGTLARDGLWLALLGVCCMFVISATFNPFIYFRF